MALRIDLPNGKFQIRGKESWEKRALARMQENDEYDPQAMYALADIARLTLRMKELREVMEQELQQELFQNAPQEREEQHFPQEDAEALKQLRDLVGMDGPGSHLVAEALAQGLVSLKTLTRLASSRLVPFLGLLVGVSEKEARTLVYQRDTYRFR